MYGHGRNVQSFWALLVDVTDTNSIWFVEEPLAPDLIWEVQGSCLSVASFNEMALRAASPAALKYGEVAHFNAHTLHGTPINSSGVTRLSFNFRIVLEDGDTGLKGEDFFVSPRASRQDHEKARDKAALHLGREGLEHVLPTQKHQQIALLQYSKDRDLVSVIEETELSGFHHYPTLFSLLDDQPRLGWCHLVIYTTDLLPAAGSPMRERFDERCRAQGITLHSLVGA
jgi:hypothetical protein